jgi:exodeoxyribonuclease VII small subunit
MAMARAKGSDTGSGSDASDTPSMGYEAARAALAEVVATLEAGDATLEEALALWEQGEQYAQICEAWLAGAQERLSQQEPSQSESAPLSD